MFQVSRIKVLAVKKCGIAITWSSSVKKGQGVTLGEELCFLLPIQGQQKTSLPVDKNPLLSLFCSS